MGIHITDNAGEIVNQMFCFGVGSDGVGLVENISLEIVGVVAFGNIDQRVFQTAFFFHALLNNPLENGQLVGCFVNNAFAFEQKHFQTFLASLIVKAHYLDYLF